MASFAACFSLALLGIAPTEEFATAPQSIILLTEPSQEMLFKSDSLDVQKVFSLRAEHRFAERVEDVGFFARHFSGFEIHLYGNRLTEADLEKLRGQRVIFHQSELPVGIIELESQRQLKLGESVNVSGIVRGNFNRLDFKVNSQLTDSLFLSQSETKFAFSFAPKDTGRFLISLALDGAEERFGVEVLAPEVLSILILESQPKFETKYLKAFLAEKNHRVAILTTVGKQRFHEEFLNQSRFSLKPLAFDRLSVFDFLLIDEPTLGALNPSERRALERQVSENGLGVFIAEFEGAARQDSSLKFFTSFPLFQSIERESRLHWKGFSGVAPPISIEAFELKSSIEFLPLVFENKIAVAGAMQRGVGKVSTSLAKNVFEWRIQGRDDVYASYWTNILSSTSKPSASERWAMPLLCFTDEPAPFSHFTSLNKSTAFIRKDDSVDTIYLRQAILNERERLGLFWPKEVGWHSVSNDSQSQSWFYVNGKNDWESLRKESSRCRISQFVQDNIIDSSIVGSRPLRRESSKLMFLLVLVFLASAGYLWVETKL